MRRAIVAFLSVLLLTLAWQGAGGAQTLLRYSQIGFVPTATVLGRNTAGTGAAEALSTLPSAVQDNITRLGTVTTGSFPAANLSGTTLAAGVVTSSLTTVGALNSGSITSGFGSINVGADSITGGAITGTTLTISDTATTLSAVTATIQAVVPSVSTASYSRFTINPRLDVTYDGSSLANLAAAAMGMLYRGSGSTGSMGPKGVTAFEITAFNFNTGTTDWLIGGRTDLRNSGTGGVFGTITNMAPLRLSAPTVSGGTVSNYYSIYIDDPGTPSANTWHLYANGSKPSYFGSTLAIGTTALPGTGTASLVLADGTAPSSMGSNTAALYGDDTAGTVGLWAIDEAGLTSRLTGAASFPTSVTTPSVFPTGAAITVGSGTGITVNSTGEVRRTVYKVTIARTAFVCAAVTCDVTLATLPAKSRIVGIVADITQTFACTATCTSSTLSMTVGSSAGGTQYLASFDADAAVARFGLVDADLGTALVRAAAVQGGDLPSWTGATAVSLRLTSGTGNIGNGSATNLSQGSITLYLTVEVYQ